MKHFERILAAIIITGCLCSCETVSSDGTVTRWDGEATIKGIGAAVDTWQKIDRQSHIVGYDQFGNPIYR